MVFPEKVPISYCWIILWQYEVPVKLRTDTFSTCKINYFLSLRRESEFVRQVYNLCVPLQESDGPFSTFFHHLSK